MKHRTLLALLFLLSTNIATAIIIAEEGSTDITQSIRLVDIYTGSTKQESGCIFDVNGQTAVVNYHTTETVNGVTIYVQEVYAVNTEAKDNDNCAFLYYIVGETVQEQSSVLNVDEAMTINTEVIGNENVEFILTTREGYEDIVQEGSEREVVDIDEETSEETVVKVNGMTVTEAKGTEESEAEQIQETEQHQTQEVGFFGRLWQFLFG